MSKQPKLFRKYADDYYRLFLVDIDGVMWASNSYWAVPVRDTKHPIARLLALYNLPLAPCALDVGETLVATGDQTPQEKFDKFAAAVRKPPEDIASLTQHCLNGSPLYGYDGKNVLALYQLPGGRFVAVNDRYRQIVEESSADSEWHGGPDPHKPIYRCHEGETTGLLMGVKCPISQAGAA